MPVGGTGQVGPPPAWVTGRRVPRHPGHPGHPAVLVGFTRQALGSGERPAVEAASPPLVPSLAAGAGPPVLIIFPVGLPDGCVSGCLETKLMGNCKTDCRVCAWP